MPKAVVNADEKEELFTEPEVRITLEDKPILKSIKATFLSHAFVQVIVFVSSFVIKRFIVPSLMGIWNLANIGVNFMGMLNLGFGSAAQREIPYSIGKGDYAREERVRETFLFMILSEIVVATIVFYLFFFWKRYYQIDYWFLYLLVPYYALTTRIYSGFVDCLQARHEFVGLSKQHAIFSVAGVTLSVLGAWLAGVIGLFIGQALFFAFRLYLTLRLATKTGMKIRAKFHSGVFKELFKLGISIQGGSYFWGFFATIDSLLVTKWLGVAPLAFYSLGRTFSRQLGDFPTRINSVLNPRIIQKFGKEESYKAITNDLIRFFVGNFLVLLPFTCLAGYFSLSWLIRMFIRNYSPAILPAQILLFSIFIVPQMHILFNIFVLKKKMAHLIFFQMMLLAITFLCILGFNFRGANLGSVALGAIFGYYLSFLPLFWVATQDVFNFYQKGKILLCQAGSIFYTLILLLLLERLFPSSMVIWTDTMHTFAKLSIGFVFCSPLAIWGMYATKTLSKVMNEITSTFMKLRSVLIRIKPGNKAGA